jgi:hypothetical protein
VALVISDALADAVAAVGKLRADDRLITSPDQMLGEFEVLRDLVTSLQAEMVHRLRDIFAADATDESAGRSTQGWLREEMLLAGVEASRYLRLLHNLRSFPLTEAAFDDADISIAHAAAIVTALQSLPAHLWETVEPHLVERARFFPPEEIAGFTDELLQALGIDRQAETRRERRNAQRRVELHKTMDGTRSLSGSLTPDVGEQLEKALELASQPSGPDDDRTPGQRRHDAMAAIANAYLGSNGAPSFTGTPRTVIITMDLETLENQLGDTWITLPGGATISAATARRLACDAELIPVVLGRGGEVLDVGEAGREFNATTRRAAYVRDGGSYHHWLVHEGHWTLRRQPADGSYLWTGPNGQQRVRHLPAA